MAEMVEPGQAQSSSDRLLRFIESGEAELLRAPDILSWALKNFHPNIALACSFGAPEGLAVLDMMHRIEPEARVFVLDTGRLPQATYDLIDRVRERYRMRVEVVFPRAEDVQKMIRKVEPLNRQLSGLDAWITGLRRDQTASRTDAPKVEIDAAHAGIVKVNPIADWDVGEVWRYVRAHDVPVSRLHAQGYPSVGCDPCSRAVPPGGDPRSGRWWWEQQGDRECGIHVVQEEQGSGI
jgi:phosphoadenosine phosphosulfate reductase